MIAQISYKPEFNKYVLEYNGKIVCKSHSAEYLYNCVISGTHKKAIRLGIKKAEIISKENTSTDIIDVPVVEKTGFDINQKFGFMEDLCQMVISKESPSVLICGDGGLGKTHTVLKCVKKSKLVDIKSLIPLIEPINTEDDEDEVNRKIDLNANQPTGDYIIIKGHSSARSLYKLLYKHKDKLIIFDDCDSILLDSTSINLLKSALDSYDARWIDWHSSAWGDDDIPSSFMFTGRVIFISNMKMHKIDPAVKTRCLKIDLSMTRDEKIERMEHCLDEIMPNVDIKLKTEALAFIKSKKDKIIDENNLNFRSLQNVIKQRASHTVKDWKSLAEFTLNEGN